MTERGWLIFILIVMDAGWGVTMPLTKIAVSESYRQFRLIFWQLMISTLILKTLLTILQHELPIKQIPLTFYTIITLINTIIPNSTNYQTTIYLPTKIISILLSIIPIFTFPITLLMDNERFTPVRLTGLVFGLIGVSILILPKTNLPERAMIVFIPLALAGLFWAVSG